MDKEVQRALKSQGINPKNVVWENLGNAYQIIDLKGDLIGYVMTDDWSFKNKGMAK